MKNAGADNVLVYVPDMSARVVYIINTLFPDWLITDSLERFREYAGAKINYTETNTGVASVQVIPFGLLSETKIHPQPTDCFEWEGWTVFFRTGGDIPFDLFSAAFFLLTRYEEYLPHELDEYGRYSHTNSLAYKAVFLKIPLVNYWIQSFEKLIQQRFPAFELSDYPFRFTPTYDIDIAYCYLHQPVWKNVFGFYRDLLQGKLEQVTERGNVYSGKKEDPFDVFSWIHSLHEQYGLQPVYFMLTIIKRGLYDKNLPAKSRALQKLYQLIAARDIAGLHPSWQSGTDEWLLEKEIKMLEQIIQKPVTVSRNHYLRFTVPATYRRLLAAQITDDYSMAYGNVNGFRASYARPFNWYDLEKETATQLQIHPFCFMEATSYFNQGYSAEEAAEEIQYYHDEVKKVGGDLITLFHNHFLTEQKQWLPWREMYAAFLAKNFAGKESVPL